MKLLHVTFIVVTAIAVNISETNASPAGAPYTANIKLTYTADHENGFITGPGPNPSEANRASAMVKEGVTKEECNQPPYKTYHAWRKGGCRCRSVSLLNDGMCEIQD